MADEGVVGILKAILKLDTAEYDKGVKQVSKGASDIDRVMGTVGKTLAATFTATAIISYGKQVLAFADNIGDLADQTGIGTTRLQALNFVMAGSGVTVEQLATGMAQLSKNLVGGDKGAAAAVRALGLNLDKLVQMNPDDAFIEIGEAVSRIPDPMERSAIMMELFGRSGSQYLKVVSEDMRAVVEGAEKTGPILDKELIARADQFDKGWEQAKLHFQAFTADAIGSVFKLGEAMGRISFPGAEKAAGFIGPKLVEGVKAVGDASVVAGGGIDALGQSSLQAAKDALALEEASKKAAEQGVKKLAEEAKRAAEATAQAYKDLYTSVALANSAFLNDQGIAQMNADMAVLQASTSAATRELVGLASIGVPEIEELSGSFDTLLVNQDGLTAGLIQGTAAIVSQDAAAGGLVDQQIAARNATIEWQTQMENLGDAFFKFGVIAGDSLGKTIQKIGAAIAGISLAKQGATSLTAGFKDLGAGSILKGLTGIVGGIGGIASAATAAIAVVTGLWKGLQRLFGGGEEGVVVNPRRDEFIAQYGGDQAMGQKILDTLMGQGMSYEAAEARRQDLMDAGLYRADTAAKLEQAQDSIINLIGGQRFKLGGPVPGTGVVPAFLHGGERVLSAEQNQWFSSFMDRVGAMPDASTGAQRVTAPAAPRSPGSGQQFEDLVERRLPKLIGRAVADALTLSPRLRTQ